MGGTVALGLLLLALSLDAQQDEVFSGPQWLATGVYSAARGANRLLFFTAVDCPNRAPAKIWGQGSAKASQAFYTLLWEEPGRLCTCSFVERSDYESEPAKIIPWVVNQPNSAVHLDSQDRASAKTLWKGDVSVSVQFYGRLAWARSGPSAHPLQTVGFFVSVNVAGNKLNALKVALEDISFSALASDLSQTQLKVTRSGEESRSGEFFDAAVPAGVRNQGFPALVRIINGENTFLFPFFVPAYSEVSQARDKRKQ